MGDLYKVLVDGKSCHGGDHVWSLPTDNGDGTWTPGAWTPTVDRVEVCERGWHLTSEPMAWCKAGMQVYRAEGDGDAQRQGNKTAFGRARLLAPAPEAIPDWWHEIEAFLADIPSWPWMRPDGNPDPAWKVFPTRDSVWASVRASVRASVGASVRASVRASVGASVGDSVRDSVWASVGDSVGASVGDSVWDSVGASVGASVRDTRMHCCSLIVADRITPAERQHIADRLNVWRKGYGLYGDRDGVLYVYERIV